MLNLTFNNTQAATDSVDPPNCKLGKAKFGENESNFTVGGSCESLSRVIKTGRDREAVSPGS